MQLDAVKIQVLWSRVVSIADEAAEGLIRTSYSSVVRDFHDFSCGLFDAKGNLLAHSTKTTTAFIGVMPFVLGHFLEHYPAETLVPGDVLLTNDPWLGTGHAYDLNVVTPIFDGAQLVGFAICIVHHMDVGGRMGTTESKDMFEEGLRIPPIRMLRAGIFDPTLEAIIRNNVRVPDKVMGDIRAQLVANGVCARGLLAMIADYGLSADDLLALSTEITDRTEASLRQKIRAVPDGRYTNQVTLPDIAGCSGITIKVAVEVKGDEILIDYEGSSGEVPAAVNVTFNMTRSYSLYPIKLALDPEVPNNGGALRPITVRAPEGTLLNCRPPAPTWGRTMICHNLPEIVLGALVEAIPDRVMAACGSTPLVFTYIRARRPDGQTYMGINSSMGGLGATARVDGASCRGFPYNVGNIPVETIENDLPIVYRHKELLVDSGGPGRQRGGLGQSFEVEVAASARDPDPAVIISIRGSGRKPDSPYPVFGRLGGMPGRGEALSMNGAVLPHGPQKQLGAGDAVFMALPGGGGYGDPLARDPRLVAADVALTYVTRAAAEADYGVVLTEAGDVDAPATEALRAERRGQARADGPLVGVAD